MTYTEQQFNLPEMPGLSAKQIDVHLKLYAGYVKNVNALTPDVAPYRLAFEFNGIRLHELYFEALGGNGVVADGALKSAIEKQYGSFDAWMTEFKTIAMTRGIGWALLTYDAKTATFHNVWVRDHEVGHLGDLRIIFALDVWEHAFMVDYVPSQRTDYINAVFQNLRWDVIKGRFTKAQ